MKTPVIYSESYYVDIGDHVFPTSKYRLLKRRLDRDESLAGKYTGSSGETEMEDLSFEDNELGFSVDVNGMVIDFSATIEGENLEGMLSLEHGEANITGTKRKK